MVKRDGIGFTALLVAFAVLVVIRLIIGFDIDQLAIEGAVGLGIIVGVGILHGLIPKAENAEVYDRLYAIDMRRHGLGMEFKFRDPEYARQLHALNPGATSKERGRTWFSGFGESEFFQKWWRVGYLGFVLVLSVIPLPPTFIIVIGTSVILALRILLVATVARDLRLRRELRGWVAFGGMVGFLLTSMLLFDFEVEPLFLRMIYVITQVVVLAALIWEVVVVLDLLNKREGQIRETNVGPGVS